MFINNNNFYSEEDKVKSIHSILNNNDISDLLFLTLDQLFSKSEFCNSKNFVKFLSLNNSKIKNKLIENYQDFNLYFFNHIEDSNIYNNQEHMNKIYTNFPLLKESKIKNISLFFHIYPYLSQDEMFNILNSSHRYENFSDIVNYELNNENIDSNNKKHILLEEEKLIHIFSIIDFCIKNKHYNILSHLIENFYLNNYFSIYKDIKSKNETINIKEYFIEKLKNNLDDDLLKIICKIKYNSEHIEIYNILSNDYFQIQDFMNSEEKSIELKSLIKKNKEIISKFGHFLHKEQIEQLTAYYFKYPVGKKLFSEICKFNKDITLFEKVPLWYGNNYLDDKKNNFFIKNFNLFEYNLHIRTSLFTDLWSYKSLNEIKNTFNINIESILNGLLEQKILHSCIEKNSYKFSEYEDLFFLDNIDFSISKLNLNLSEYNFKNKKYKKLSQEEKFVFFTLLSEEMFFSNFEKKKMIDFLTEYKYSYKKSDYKILISNFDYFINEVLKNKNNNIENKDIIISKNIEQIKIFFESLVNNSNIKKIKDDSDIILFLKKNYHFLQEYKLIPVNFYESIENDSICNELIKLKTQHNFDKINSFINSNISCDKVKKIKI